jgi:hypothetical protein
MVALVGAHDGLLYVGLPDTMKDMQLDLFLINNEGIQYN